MDKWEALEGERPSWRSTIASGAERLESDQAQAAEAKRQKGHHCLLLLRPPPTLSCS